MKNVWPMTFLALMLVTCSGPGFDAADLKKFTAYEEVFQKAFTGHAQYIDNKWFLQLARKPDGWYIVKTDVETSKEVQLLQFWSVQNNEYLPFDNEISRAQQPGMPPQQPDPSRISMFRIIPFYGYEKWYEDVIENFEGAELTDTLTEALGRAYETKALLESGMSYGANGKAVSNMSAKQENVLIENMNKALDLYKALYAKNPEYNTVVGNAQNKYSNQCMSAYASLKYFGHADKGRQFLKEGLYTPFIINFAKNMLSCCDKNGILVTYGDNDYFPLLYVQNKLGWRTDVALLNINLMMVDGYIDKYISFNKLKHQIDAKVYADKNLDVVLLDRSEQVLKVGEVLGDFSKGNFASYLKDMGNGRKYCVLSGSALEFDNPAVSPVYEMKLGESFVYKNDLFLWDILYSNGRQRPVYLVSMGNWKPYMPNLSSRGMALAFTYEQADSTMRLDTAFVEKALLHDFNYGWPQKPSLTERVLANNYVYQFYGLANACKNAGRKEKAIGIIQKCLETFPQNNMQVNYTYFLMARLLEDCGDESGAVRMGNDYADALAKELKTAKGRERQDLLRNLQGTTTMLMGASEKWDDVRKKLENLLEVYMKEAMESSGIPVQ